MNLPIIAAAGWVINLFLVPLTTVILTLAYLKFTKVISNPGLAKRQEAA